MRWVWWKKSTWFLWWIWRKFNLTFLVKFGENFKLKFVVCFAGIKFKFYGEILNKFFTTFLFTLLSISRSIIPSIKGKEKLSLDANYLSVKCQSIADFAIGNCSIVYLHWSWNKLEHLMTYKSHHASWSRPGLAFHFHFSKNLIFRILCLDVNLIRKWKSFWQNNTQSSKWSSASHVWHDKEVHHAHPYVKHFYFFFCNNSYTIFKPFKIEIIFLKNLFMKFRLWIHHMMSTTNEKKIITSKWAKMGIMSRILCIWTAIAYLTFIGGKIYDLEYI